MIKYFHLQTHFLQRQALRTIILLHLFILLSNCQFGNVLAVIVENNPFYGLNNAKINSIENLTNDKQIKVRLEYAPETFDASSPEFFKITLYYADTNQVVLHADTDIIISKNGNEVFKESNEFSQPFVHTPNGIVLSSFKFQDVGEYMITIQLLGINFMPIVPKQVNFMASINNNGEGHGIIISTKDL